MGGISHLAVDPTLDHIGICLHATLGILICVGCRYAFSLGDVAGHLVNQHHIVLTLNDRTYIQNLTDSGALHRRISDAPIPTNYGPPVELIHTQVGFICQVEGCGYASGAVGTMEAHRREVHRLGTPSAVHNPSAHVQRLTKGVGGVFFTVEPQLAPHHSGTPFAIFQAQVLPHMPIPAFIDLSPSSRSIGPLHRVTQWYDILGDYAMDREKHSDVLYVASKDMMRDHMGQLPDLCKQYLRKAQAMSKNAGFTVRQQLVPDR